MSWRSRKPGHRIGGDGFGSAYTNPLRQAIEMQASLLDALNPEKASGKPVTLAQMSEEKRAEMLRLYANGPTKKRWEQ